MINFKTPSFHELSYRKHLLSDINTMKYNAGYNVSYARYDYETGCIDFDESKWRDWYKSQVENKQKFYAYIYNNRIPVGEVYFSESGVISIIIEAKYRGKGYAKQSLKMLIDKAFKDYKLESLEDVIPESRSIAINLFQSFGFVVEEKRSILKFNKSEKVLLNCKMELSIVF